jgi:hypothetical protein
VQSDRLLAFLDRNLDLYIASVAHPAPVKLAASVQSFAWNGSADILAAITDNQLVVWYYPAACLAHKDLVDLTRERKALRAGESASIQEFCDQLVSVRLGDGAQVAVAISPYALKFYALAEQAKCASSLQAHVADRCMHSPLASRGTACTFRIASRGRAPGCST